MTLEYYSTTKKDIIKIVVISLRTSHLLSFKFSNQTDLIIHDMAQISQIPI